MDTIYTSIKNIFKKDKLNFMYVNACSGKAFAGVKCLVTAFGGIINALIPMAFGLAFLFFFWGVAMFISSAGSDDKVKKSKSIMTYGIVAIFVISSIFGIIQLIGINLNISTPIEPGDYNVNDLPVNANLNNG